MDWLSEVVSRHGMWVALPAVFLGGIALNFTPCVYPMIPVTFVFFSGQASARNVDVLHNPQIFKKLQYISE